MKIVKLMVCAGLLVTAASVSAFDFKVPGSASTSASAGGAAVAQQASILDTYSKAALSINAAQAEMIEALGFKDKAAALQAQGQAFSDGSPSKDEIEKNTAISADAAKTADEAIAGGAVLSDEAKLHFAKSLLPMITGLKLNSQMIPALKPFGEAAKADISNAPMLQKPSVTSSLAPGMYLVKEFPGYATNLLDSFKKYVKFAQSNQIPVPKEATDLL